MPSFAEASESKRGRVGEAEGVEEVEGIDELDEDKNLARRKPTAIIKMAKTKKLIRKGIQGMVRAGGGLSIFVEASAGKGDWGNGGVWLFSGRGSI